MSADPLVQFFITSNSLNSAADNGSPPIPNTSERTRYHYLNHPSTAGNYLWICFRVSDAGQDGSGNPTITVKDDTSTSWTQDTLSPVDETTNGTKLCYFYRENVPAGIRRIEVDATAQISYAAGCGGEFSHVAASSSRNISKVGKSAASSASFASGSMTTTVTDIVLHIACGQGSTTYANMFGIQAGYTCLGADMITNFAAQYNWDVAAGATNPALTPNGGSSDPNGFVSFTIGLVMDTSQGSQPSKATPRVVRAMWGDLEWSTIGSAFTSAKMQIPCRGRLLISGTQIPAGSSFSDSTNGAWAHTSEISQVGSGDVKFDYKLNPTTSSTGLLLTMSSIPGGSDPAATVCILDVECDTPLVFDTVAGVPLLTGNQGTTATLAPISITPSAPGGFAMFNIAINTGTGQETTTANCYPLHPWSPQYNGGENVVAEDDIWAFMTPSSTATLTPGFTCADQGAGVKQWSAAAISFIPAVVNAPPRPLPYAMDVTKNCRLRALRTRAAYSTTLPAAATPVSNTASSSTENVSLVAQTAAAPDETLSSTAKTASIPDESIALAANTRTSPDESTQAMTRAAANADENTGRVTLTLAAPDENIGPISRTLASPDESLARATTSIVDAWESLARPIATVTSSDESLLSLTKSATSADESLQTIAGTRTSPDENLGVTATPVSQTEVVAWESLAPVTGTRTAPDESLGRAAGTRISPDEWVSPIAATRSSADESLATATHTQSAGTESLGSMARTATAPTESRGLVQRALLTAFEWFSPVSAARSSTSESLSSTARTQSASTESLGGARRAAIVPTESKGLLARALAMPFEWFSRIARTFVAPFEIGFDITQPPVYPGGTFAPDAIEATFTPDTTQATFVADDIQATFTPTLTE